MSKDKPENKIEDENIKKSSEENNTLEIYTGSTSSNMINYDEAVERRKKSKESTAALNANMKATLKQSVAKIYGNDTSLSLMWKGVTRGKYAIVKAGFSKAFGKEISPIDNLEFVICKLNEKKNVLKDDIDETHERINTLYKKVNDNIDAREQLRKDAKKLQNENVEYTNLITEMKLERGSLKKDDEYSKRKVVLDKDITEFGRKKYDNQVKIIQYLTRLDGSDENFDQYTLAIEEQQARLPSLIKTFVSVEQKIENLNVAVETKGRPYKTIENILAIDQDLDSARECVKDILNVANNFNEMLPDLAVNLGDTPVIGEKELAGAYRSIGILNDKTEQMNSQLSLRDVESLSNMTNTDCYDALNLRVGASDKEVKEAVRGFEKKYHPDKSGGKTLQENEKALEKIRYAASVLYKINQMGEENLREVKDLNQKRLAENYSQDEDSEYSMLEISARAAEMKERRLSREE